MTFQALRFQVGAGEGLAARSSGGALLVPRWSPEQSRILDELVGVVEAPDTGDATSARLLARRVAGIITREEPDAIPAFAALFSTDEGGVAMIVHGDVDVTVTSSGQKETLSGRNVATWIDHVVHQPVDTLVVEPAGGAPPPAARFDLRSGVVPAGALLVTRMPTPSTTGSTPVVPPTPPRAAEPPSAAGAASPASAPSPASTPPPQPSAPTDEPDTPFQPISLHDGGPDDARGPLPLASEIAEASEDVGPDGPAPVIVEGIACSRGHFNHPDARFCHSCGIGMVQLTHNVIEGKRPPLGVLLLDDGTTFSLSTDVVIGRAPESHPAVASGGAQPLVVDDAERSLSRIHAFVELSGWEVRMKDCGSANGTAIQGPGESDWTPLPADQPTTLVSGATVRLGKRTFVYDARHR